MPCKKKRGTAKRKAAGKAAADAKKRKLHDEIDPDTQIERKEINLATLDLRNKKYVEEWKAPDPPKRPERQERWKQEGEGPMNDKKKLPKGWNTDEPDLDPNDFDAQIERCKERLEDNIMPFVFQGELKVLERKKAEKDKVKAGEPADLPWDSYVRINELKILEADIKSKKPVDPFLQLPNIKALLAGYRAGELIWRHGLVTYWSDGKQLCEPRRLDWDEFEALNKASPGDRGFWVECNILTGPGPHHACARIVVPENPAIWNHHTNVQNRPSTSWIRLHMWWEQLDFAFDTGSSGMLINDYDVQSLMDPVGPPWGSRVKKT